MASPTRTWRSRSAIFFIFVLVSGSLSSPASASTVINADQSASRPKLVTLDSGASTSLSSVKTRKRSNSADGTVSYASFRNGRYVARPRHAHPGPPSLEQIVRTVRGPQPSDRPGSSNGRPRSNSRSSDHGPIGWSQRGNMAMFADAGIPAPASRIPTCLELRGEPPRARRMVRRDRPPTLRTPSSRGTLHASRHERSPRTPFLHSRCLSQLPRAESVPATRSTARTSPATSCVAINRAHHAQPPTPLPSRHHKTSPVVLKMTA